MEGRGIRRRSRKGGDKEKVEGRGIRRRRWKGGG